MSKLPKAKRDRLILVGTITAMIVAGLWFFVISDQRETMVKVEERAAKTREKIANAELKFKTRDQDEKKLNERLAALEAKESEMAPEDDPYVWMLEQINRFKQGRQIEFFLNKPNFSSVDLLPTFSYKAAVFHCTGNGLYPVIGRFIADFENEFRYFQIRNVTLKPVGSLPSGRPGTAVTGDEQTLSVEFDIIALVRPSTTSAK